MKDRQTSQPGGCECEQCGVIFIGGPQHNLCGVCARAALAAQPGSVGESDAWKPISTLDLTDELIWVRKGNSIDGPKVADTDDYDRYESWAPCEPPRLAAAPTEAKPAQPTALTLAQRRELIDRAGDITDGLNQDDFADEIINQVIAAIKTGASNG